MDSGKTSDELDRPSDYGVNAAFWNSAETHTDVGVSLNPPPAPPLTKEQLQRRAGLRRLVAGIVAGFGALALVAAIIAIARREHAPSPTSAATRTLPDTQPLAPPPALPVAVTTEAAASPVSVPAGSSAFDWQAFAAAPAPDAASLSSWTSATKGFAHAQFVTADRSLARAARKGDTGQREAARLARALLWQTNGYRGAARRTLLQLAERAKTPLVRDDARAALDLK